MSGYRGIFLDSIHPNIVNRLNADTEGLGRSDANPLNQNISLTTYKYMQERTPWLRAVPFTIPQNIYGVNNIPVDSTEENEELEEGQTPDTETKAPSSNMNLIVENYPRVPHWRNWVLYGTKSRSIHGNKQTSHIHPDQPWSSVETATRQDSTAVFGRDLYPSSTMGWNQTQAAGNYQSPPPGITNLSVSNKGDLGTIRRATIDIKVHNLSDLEAIEMMYMVPGMSILVEWGWYHPKMSVSPIDVETIKGGDELNSTRAINEKILYKSFDIKPGQLHNISDPTAFNIAHPELGTKAGLYDGFLGTVTKFNWSNDGQGGYDVRIDIIAPGSLTTGISVETYKMATKIADQEDGTERSITDVAAAAAILQKTTNQVESLLEKEIVQENLDAEVVPQTRTTQQGDGYDANADGTITIPVKTQALDRKNKGVQVSKNDDGSLSWEVTVLDPDSPPTETVDYFLEEYKGGNEYEVERIKGDPNWWRRCIMYLTADWNNELSDAHDSLNVNQLQDNDRPDEIHDYTGDNDEEYNILKLNQEFGPAWRSGNYYVKRDSAYKKRPGPGEWKLMTWVGGLYKDTMENHAEVTGGVEQFRINGKNKAGTGTAGWNDFMFAPGKRNMGNANLIYASQGSRTPRMVDPSTNPDWSNKGFDIGDKHCVDYWQDIKGSKTLDSVAKNKGWSKDEDNNYVDANGNAVNVQGGSGNLEVDQGGGWDPVIIKKKKGVSLISRTTDADGNVTYTVVDHLQGEDATQLTKEFNKALKDKDTQVTEDAELARQEKIEANAGIVAAIENKAGVTWGKPSVSPTVCKYASQVCLRIPSKRRPTSGPDGERTGYEVGYDILNETSADNPNYPVGVVALADTYVSWRFIEDYLINELFMPRLEISGNDAGAVQDLETRFGSWDIMSDREKIKLITNLSSSGSDRNKKIQDEIQRQIDANQSDRDNSSENTNPVDNTFNIIKPTQIINHRNIRSTNSKVCLLPGQERPASETNAEGVGFTPNSDAKYLIDYAADGKSGEDVKFYDQNAAGKNAMNQFIGFNSDGSRDPNSGILRNIVVNLDFLNEVAENSNNVRDFAMGLLDGINEACGMPWSFKIITIAATNQLKVIDENYTPDMGKFRKEATKDYQDKETGVYMFTGAGSKNILKDVKIQSKLPSELATAAYFATMNPDPDGNANIQTFAMYGVGLTDRLKQLSRTVIVGDNGEQAKSARATMVTSYLEGVINSRLDHVKQKSPAAKIAEAMKMNKLYVNNYVKGNSFEVKNYAPPIPIDVSLDLHGISGIYMGNAIMIATIAEGGILPSRYKDVVALQCTAVNHSISPEGWTTSIDTLMRPLPMTNRTGKIVQTTMKSAVEPPPKAEGGLHVHWKRFLEDVAWSAGCISYIIKKSTVDFPFKGAHTKYSKKVKEGFAGWQNLDPGTTPIKVGDVVVKCRGVAKNFFTSNYSGESHGDIVTEINGNKAIIIGGNVSNTMTKVTLPLDSNGKIPTVGVNTGAKGSYFVILRADAPADRAKVSSTAQGVFANYPGVEKERQYKWVDGNKYAKIGKAKETSEEAAMLVYDMYKAGRCWSTKYQCSSPHPTDGLSSKQLERSIKSAANQGGEGYNIDTGQVAV